MKHRPPPRFPVAERSVDQREAWQTGPRLRDLPYSDEELLASLENALKLHALELKQRKNLLGRLLALFQADVAEERISVDGVRLRQLYNLAGVAPSLEANPEENLLLEAEELRRLLIDARKAVAPSAPPSGHWFRTER